MGVLLKVALTDNIDETMHADSSIEAPPSIMPPQHYCDITGLEARRVFCHFTSLSS